MIVEIKVEEISVQSHLRFCKKLLNQISLCEQDNDNLSMFMLSVDLDKLRREVECEIREYEG